MGTEIEPGVIKLSNDPKKFAEMNKHGFSLTQIGRDSIYLSLAEAAMLRDFLNKHLPVEDSNEGR